MRYPVRKIPGVVLASVFFHAALVTGLFFVAGIAARIFPAPVRTVVRAETEAPDEVLPEPPETEPEMPEAPPDAIEPVIPDDPIEEPPLFTDESDPEDWDPNALPPETAPRNWSRKAIGIGGGGPVAPRPPPPPPEKKTAPKPQGPTKKAAPRHAPGPRYPRRAAERGYQGKVDLLVEVMPDGKLGKIEITKSSGYSILDDEAIRTVRKWVFEPAMVEGRPVRSLVVVPFSFEFKD